MDDNDRRAEARRAAGRYVHKAAAVAGKPGIADIAEAAGVDAGTVGDFLGGHRWPIARTRKAIEDALELPTDAIQAAYDTALHGDQPSDPAPRVEVVDKGMGETSQHNVVSVRVAAMGVEVETTFTDAEDRARVITEIMRAIGLEGGTSEGVSVPNGGGGSAEGVAPPRRGFVDRRTPGRADQ